MGWIFVQNVIFWWMKRVQLLLLLFGRIDHILHKAAVRHKATVAADSLIPWTDIISACVEYQLAWLRYHKVCCCSS